MDKLGIKATLYDFFGYLVPGLVLILYLYIFYRNIDKELNFWVILQNLTSYYKTIYALLVVLVGYCLGHIVSSASSFIMEKRIVEKIKFFKSKLDLKALISSDLYSVFEEKYRNCFKVNYDCKDIRTLICYVEKNNHEIYSTAFVFLSIYGMARSLSIISFIFAILEVGCFFYIKSKLVFMYALCGFGLGVVFFYEYFRFKKYFLTEILNGILV
ncbi:MAG: hypothetical protein SPD90_06645 [Intestinibacter sp.]|uniref:hypothetical protein n=1 Tax=Intestinibacter sp. TaxID=1965304 RepID=UPI002A805A5C|nr:hypothetical protein [Intestinibacter sp.]MDY4574719.1 hypothetical protein [Intestinibacter sp.]